MGRPPRTIAEIDDAVITACEDIKLICDRAENENRDLTAEECREVDAIEEKIRSAKAIEIGIKLKDERIAKKLHERVESGQITFPGDGETNSRRFGSGGPVTVLENHDGAKCYALTNQQSVAALPSASKTDCDYPVGETLRALAHGMTDRTPGSVRNLMTESKVGSGGVMVPIQFASRLVDIARARSVLNNAGMTTMVMESSETSMAAVETDPTFEIKQEGQAFTASDITFGERKLNAYLIGTYIKASRELVADAPNFAQIVETVLGNALAAELDKIGIQGKGSKPVGLTGNTLINETGSIGAIAWEDVATAALTVRNNNREPNSYVCHNTIAHDLLMLTTGDGTNAAKGWLPSPPTLDNVGRYSSTNCPLANLIIGDFSYYTFGLRQGVMIETTTEADDAFAKHQMWFKITLRGDFAVLDANAFERLAGITS